MIAQRTKPNTRGENVPQGGRHDREGREAIFAIAVVEKYIKTKQPTRYSFWATLYKCQKVI